MEGDGGVKGIQGFVDEICAREEVEAFALGGSRATGKSDEKSDYDVYIYLKDSLDYRVKEEILSKYCSYMEIENHYWELEDNCTLKNGTDIDIIYRNIEVFTEELKSVVEDCHSRNGYTTCMWHNLLTSQILYDKSGKLQQLKDRFSVKYPKQLKQNIIKNNMKLLSGVLPSYDTQIKKAVERNDFVSINHRITEFLASYFDVIFAMNEMTHPGEKRLLALCKEQCKILPNNFEGNLLKLFGSMFEGEEVIKQIKLLISELRTTVGK